MGFPCRLCFSAFKKSDILYSIDFFQKSSRIYCHFSICGRIILSYELIFSDIGFNISFIMTRILKSVFGSDSLAPFVGDFFKAVILNIGSPESVLAASQAPIGFPHAVPRCLVCPQEPAVIRLVESFEAVFPCCRLVGIKFTHHHRNIGKNKLCEPGEKIENEV